MQVEGRWKAEHGTQFNEYPKIVRGYIRYEVTRANLQASLSEFLSSPRRIADIGAGTGRDARWLANLKPQHEVTVVEPELEAFTTALRLMGGVQNFSQGDTSTALRRFDEEAFDFLISHGVLQYVNYPGRELKKMARLLQPGGYLSLLIASRYGKMRRYKNDPEALRKIELAGVYVNNVGAGSRSYFPSEVERMLEAAGLEVVDWFGTRVASDDDWREIDKMPAFELNRIVATEIELSRHPVQKLDAQMLHYIARKNT